MAVDRFAVYSSLALIFGVGAFTTVLAPARVACEIARRLRPCVDAAVTVFLVGTLLWLPLEAGHGPDSAVRDHVRYSVARTDGGLPAAGGSPFRIAR
jgi:putative copper export protein